MQGLPRFAFDPNRLTGGGISSGLDEALMLIQLLRCYGRQVDAFPRSRGATVIWRTYHVWPTFPSSDATSKKACVSAWSAKQARVNATALFMLASLSQLRQGEGRRFGLKHGLLYPSFAGLVFAGHPLRSNARIWRYLEMSLSGEWINELGSRMRLDATEDGHLSGSYHTQVGDAEGIYRLVGTYDVAGAGGSQSLAFCVSWQNDDLNSHSGTAWAGQFQTDEQGDVITTTWLLTRETGQADDWESTNVGQDVFRRVLEGKQWKSARRGSSHPSREPSLGQRLKR